MTSKITVTVTGEEVQVIRFKQVERGRVASIAAVRGAKKDLRKMIGEMYEAGLPKKAINK